MARKRKDRERAPARIVSAKDTAATPLAGTLSKQRLRILLGVVVLLAIAALLTVFRPRQKGDGASEGPRVELPRPTGVVADVRRIVPGDFVGAEACASCHPSQYARWRGSTHGNAGGAPGRTAVVARFNGEPIRFKDAVVIPSARGTSYSFTVKRTNRADQVFRVDGIVGGGHMQGGGTQGFVSRFPDGTVRFLPFDFARKEGVWFCNTAGRVGKGWVPITPDLVLADCGDWPPARILGDELRFSNCQSCHGSQIAVTLDSAAARFETSFTSLAINCESCHGPGRQHLALVSDAKAVAAGNIGMQPLATNSKDASLGVCWQCHALKDHLKNGYLAGKQLDAYYSLRLPQLGDQAHFADGRVRTFAYQQGHLSSECYVNGGMTCTSCHDPHSQGYRDVTGTPLPGRLDDRQCTSCHQAKGAAVTEHSKHRPGSPGSACVSCHMPYLQEPEVGTALRYARSDHAIPIPRPGADSSMGVVSACKTCHANRSEQSLDAQVVAWYGSLKPRATGVTAALQLSAMSDRAKASALVLNPAERHTAALFAGMAQFAERFLSLDMADLEQSIIDRLDQLGAHPDLDVRALALASLHYAAGERPAVRTRLAKHLMALGPDEVLVRSRWTVVLGFFADRAREQGKPLDGAKVYAKALDIEPDNPRLHLNLGVALSEAGDFAQAAGSLRASLTINPAQPLAFVNLGIALASRGDKVGAVEAYQSAIRLNARESLAWFNLGNVYFQENKQSEASSAYAKAAESDPSLAIAHFYLARSLAKGGDLARALREVEVGLEFEPENQEALEARAQLRQALTGAGRAR